MSEVAGGPAPATTPSAGRLLREAREKQGLHIAALAAAIKVSPKKLELLESDRFDELPDATFTRALAQTVCRALKTDPSAVMRLLPPPLGHRLEQVGEGLNTPFRERPGALVQRDWGQFFANPGLWFTLLILAAAFVVYLLPPSITGLPTGRTRPASAPQASVEPGMPPDADASGRPASEPLLSSSVAEPALVAASEPPPARSTVTGSAADLAAGPIVSPAVATAPAASAGLAAAASAPGALPPGMLQLRILSASWIEVSDGRGQPLVSRLMKAGESAGVDGVPPLKVRIGNASGTQLVFRGQPTDLKAFTRDNVARLELR